MYNLTIKHEKKTWINLTLKNVLRSDNLGECLVKQMIPNTIPGRYICQLQSTCGFGASNFSERRTVCKEEKV